MSADREEFWIKIKGSQECKDDYQCKQKNGYSGFVFSTSRHTVYSAASINNAIHRAVSAYNKKEEACARKEDREAGAFAQLRLHGNLTAKTHHDGLADRESEACSLLEFIFLIEAVEHHLTVVFIHAYTCVLDIEFHPVVFGRIFPTKSYRAFVCKLARIGEEVA